MVLRACSTLGVDAEESGAKFLTVWKVQPLTISFFDLWNNGYNWAMAHHKVDLPVLLIDYGKKHSSVRVGGRKFRDEVNDFVADLYELHGWGAEPPYFQDQTGPGVPTYGNPRSMNVLQPDGMVRRAVATPPPEPAGANSS